MGAAPSGVDRVAEAEVSWVVLEETRWTSFVERRYGRGLAATGIASTVAVPRLLRKRMQDWAVEGFSFWLAETWVSVGRELRSLSVASSTLFYGVDIHLGRHIRSMWSWDGGAAEWLLRFHMAILEPVPHGSPGAPLFQQKWPGRPRYLTEGEDGEPASSHSQASQSSQSSSSAAVPSYGTDAEHVLSIFLSNAEGHIGQLTVPVPHEKVEAVRELSARWCELHAVPLTWAGRRWSTLEDFRSLRESSLNMPDLLLLILEPDLAGAMTPDWTWEKYPRGVGDIAYYEEEPPCEQSEEPPEQAAGASDKGEGGSHEPESPEPNHISGS